MSHHLQDPSHVHELSQVEAFIEAQRKKLCETLDFPIDSASQLLRYRLRIEPYTPYLVINVDWVIARFLDNNEFYARLSNPHYSVISTPHDMEVAWMRQLVDMWVMVLKSYVRLYNIDTPKAPMIDWFGSTEKVFVDTINLLISLDRF